MSAVTYHENRGDRWPTMAENSHFLTMEVRPARPLANAERNNGRCDRPDAGYEAQARSASSRVMSRFVTLP